MKHIATIQAKDIGGAFVTALEGSKVHIYGLIGHVQKIDVGKKIYRTATGILQIESCEQRDKRLGLDKLEQKTVSVLVGNWGPGPGHYRMDYDPDMQDEDSLTVPQSLVEKYKKVMSDYDNLMEELRKICEKS